jgi:hypothetical protein
MAYNAPGTRNAFVLAIVLVRTRHRKELRPLFFRGVGQPALADAAFSSLTRRAWLLRCSVVAAIKLPIRPHNPILLRDTMECPKGLPWNDASRIYGLR